MQGTAPFGHGGSYTHELSKAAVTTQDPHKIYLVTIPVWTGRVQKVPLLVAKLQAVRAVSGDKVSFL